MLTDSKKVRVRFAPSPTGALHVGGARTALFNYLFARKYGGVHILRIEDTDEARSTEEALDAILDGLQWLRIGYDEGPFFQSERNAIYQRYAARLLERGMAYPCSCSEQRLEEIREEQRRTGKKPQYDRLHRPAESTPQPNSLPTKSASNPFVIRLRVPEQGETVFHDLILGEIRTANEELDDFIIIRSDGSPTYNFTVVVDDIEMAISHVIRGMDHVSNTPKQLVIYQAFGIIPPQFAHVPMILGPDKKKLSKRHGATSVFEYKNEGYLPDAFINYLARLGWSHGDQELFSRAELESLFTLENIGKSPAVFDQEKLGWVNAEHLKQMSGEQLVPHVAEFLAGRGFDTSRLLGDRSFQLLLESLRERVRRLDEMAAQCEWFFCDDNQIVIEERARTKHLAEPRAKEALVRLIDKLKTVEPFTEPQIEAAFQAVTKDLQLNLVKVAQPVRVALTGTDVSPPIYTVLEVLGRARSLTRLEKAVNSL